MPFFMTNRAQIRFRPQICIVSKNMSRCPMVIFSTFCIANFTNKRGLKWIKLFYFDIRFFDSFAFCKSWNSFPTDQTVKRIFWIPTRINVMANTPSNRTTVLTRMFRIFYFIFPRGINHEAMPFLQ